MAALQYAKQEQIRRVFESHDVDGSGTIDLQELVPALEELGINASRVPEILNAVDSDSSGQLDMAEFAEIFANGRLRNVFDEIDRDRSGTISTSELQVALKKLGCTVRGSQVADMLARVDTNDDGMGESPMHSI
eukprot:SAG31_NODE_12669_length_925_cov_1.898305_1_plen_133_part_10